MPTINQTSNKISRRLGPLERSLKPKLLAFYNKYIRGSNAPIQLLRQRYGRQIEKIIRDNVQTAWLFANEIVSERTNKPNIFDNDAQGIDQVTQQMVNQFWTTAGKNLEREQLSVIQNGRLVEAVEFDTSAAMLGVSSFILYLAFNESMQSKNGIKLLWRVRDDCIDNVICLPLNGQIFEVGLAPTPVVDTHRHCHCRLIPILA